MRFFLLTLVVVCVVPAVAEPESLEWSGFAFEMEVTVAGDPVTVFDAFTGETLAWWDHHLSEKPVRMYFETHPGGGFFEIFDEEGHGAVHATINVADRGKLLRFTGPLGLTGKAIEIVHTLRFTAVEGGTRLHLEVRGGGESIPGIGAVVEKVWHHFLVERFRPYMAEKTGS